MSKVKYSVRFMNKNEELQRLVRKNTKEDLACILVDIWHTLTDEAKLQHEKLLRIESLVCRSYW